MSKHETRPERSELRVVRHEIGPPKRVHIGLPLAEPAETLLGCAADLKLLDMVVLCDAALHVKACTPEDLVVAAAQRRRGAPMLRRVLSLADGRSESAWESMLRVLHVVCDVPVQPQADMFDDEVFVARGDLLITGTRTLHEYDGEEHLKRPRQRKDLSRARRLGHIGYTRRGYTSHEVRKQAVGILRDADRSLGRVHRPERVRAWHALLMDSLFTPSGTERLRRRWKLPSAAGGAAGSVAGSAAGGTAQTRGA